jgi:hypothetical protein
MSPYLYPIEEGTSTPVVTCGVSLLRTLAHHLFSSPLVSTPFTWTAEEGVLVKWIRMYSKLTAR